MTTYFNWSAGKQPGAPYNRPSPNLLAIAAEIGKRYGGYSLGCYAVRPIRGGVAWSTHAFGAAIDWRIDDSAQRNAAIVWLIANEEALGVSAIHDYVGCRIFHVGRGWKTQAKSSTGMGQAWARWLHIETNPERWGDARPVMSRFGATPPPASGLIDAATPAVPFPLYMNGPTDPERVRWLQQILNERFGASLTVDGGFGAATKAAVIKMQGVLKVVPDGLYGQQTAAALAVWLAAH